MRCLARLTDIHQRGRCIPTDSHFTFGFTLPGALADPAGSIEREQRG